MQDKETIYARWLSGDLSTQELDNLQDDGTIQELEKIVNTVDRWTLPKYNTVEGYDKLKARRPAKQASIRQINWKWVVGIAASLFIVIMTWFIAPMSNEQTIIAGNGATEQISTPDGSTIMINDGSQVTYNSEEWDVARNISLEGEALFEVEKGMPFIVSTHNGTVEVLGTQFNVRDWGHNMYVECYEGSVRVRIDGQESILSQGETVYIASGMMQQKQKIDHESPSWTNGSSRFYEEDVAGVIAELERQYDINVNVDVTSRPFSGNFPHDNLEVALRNICVPLGLIYSISSDRKTVLIESQ